jgi:hypothetical protein
MRTMLVILFFTFATALAPQASASSRAIELCAAETCDCPRQVRNCAPVCRIEPFLSACPSA